MHRIVSSISSIQYTNRVKFWFHENNLIIYNKRKTTLKWRMWDAHDTRKCIKCSKCIRYFLYCLLCKSIFHGNSASFFFIIFSKIANFDKNPQSNCILTNLFLHPRYNIRYNIRITSYSEKANSRFSISLGKTAIMACPRGLSGHHFVAGDSSFAS